MDGLVILWPVEAQLMHTNGRGAYGWGQTEPDSFWAGFSLQFKALTQYPSLDFWLNS